jgi:hypothetical protein
MPTVLQVDGYRFFFYSNEGSEPPHIHVEKAEASCKWWLQPVELAWNAGFKQPQLRVIHRIVLENQNLFRDAWNDFFGA